MIAINLFIVRLDDSAGTTFPAPPYAGQVWGRPPKGCGISPFPPQLAHVTGFLAILPSFLSILFL